MVEEWCKFLTYILPCDGVLYEANICSHHSPTLSLFRKGGVYYVGKVFYRSREATAQSFEDYEDDYYLDSKGVLAVKPAPRDIQEYIDSFRETRLESILDKFLSGTGLDPRIQFEFDGTIAEVQSIQSDLDRILEADKLVESFRLENDMPYASREDVMQSMRDKSNLILEAMKNEKEIISASESQELHPNGSESASEKLS